MSAKPDSSEPPLWKEIMLYAVLLLLAEFLCAALWANASVQLQWVQHHRPGIPQPHLFKWVSQLKLWLLFAPLPWLVYALYGWILGRRSAFKRLVFASTLIMSMMALALVVFTALAMPHMEIIKAVGR